jgi:hypothetical protein
MAVVCSIWDKHLNGHWQHDPGLAAECHYGIRAPCRSESRWAELAFRVNESLRTPWRPCARGSVLLKSQLQKSKLLRRSHQMHACFGAALLS